MYLLCNTKGLFILVLCCVSLLPNGVMAQADAERIIQLEQERRTEELRQLEQQRRNRIILEPQQESTPSQMPDLLVCREIGKIDLQGVSIFSLDKFDPVISTFISRCLNVADINELLRQINAVYFDSGYVTSRAYLPPQNLEAGELIIQIVEGQLDSLGRQPPALIKQSLWPAFPSSLNAILNLRDLEQGLEQINRLGSRDATMELLPGAEVGDTQVLIDEKILKKSWQVRLQNNNSGQDSTGKMQQQLFLGIDNLIHLYDYTYISLQSDTEPDSERKRSRSVSFHWDMPFGYWNFSTDISYFDYLSTVYGNTNTFETSGLSRSQQISIRRNIHRSQRSKTQVGFTLKRKTTENYIEDTLLQPSSRTLSIAELTVEHEHFFAGGGLLVGQFGYVHGLHLWSSLNDSDFPESGSPKAQFDKYTFSLNFEKPLSFAGVNLNYQSRLVTQYSRDILFVSEQIIIGSIYTVRGYKKNSLASNNGAYWRNALSWHWQPARQSSWLTRITPLLAFDVGTVHDNTPGANNFRSLKGAAFGLSAAGQYWVMDVTYARPINPPDNFLKTGEQLEFAITFVL